MNRRMGLGAGGVLALLAVLTACVGSPQVAETTAEPTSTNTHKPGPTLHPTGVSSLWLNDDYANGVGETWAFTGRICWIDKASGVAVIERDNALHGMRLGATEQVWERSARESCDDVTKSRPTDAAPYLRIDSFGTVDDPTDRHTLIDLRTGATVIELAEVEDTGIQLIGANAAHVFYETSHYPGQNAIGTHSVVAVQPDGTQVWTAPLADMSLCGFSEAYISCETYDPHTVTNIDVSTGAVLGTQAVAEGESFTMLSDGYALSNLTAHTAEVFDLRGKRTGTVAQTIEPGNTNPAPLFSQADALTGDLRYSTLAAGNGDQPFPDGTNSVQLSTTDGPVFVIPRMLTADGTLAIVKTVIPAGWSFVDTATMTFRDEPPRAFTGSVVGGYLVTHEGVLLPAER